VEATYYSTDVANFGREDEFHEAMVPIIPSLVKLLRHIRAEIQSAAVSLLEKLAERGEWQLHTLQT
jgi:hypothetical protein